MCQKGLNISKNTAYNKIIRLRATNKQIKGICDVGSSENVASLTLWMKLFCR
jgi:hypothetical protein